MPPRSRVATVALLMAAYAVVFVGIVVASLIVGGGVAVGDWFNPFFLLIVPIAFVSLHVCWGLVAARLGFRRRALPAAAFVATGNLCLGMIVNNTDGVHPGVTVAGVGAIVFVGALFLTENFGSATAATGR